MLNSLFQVESKKCQKKQSLWDYFENQENVTQMTLKTKKYFFLHFWIRLTSSKNISKILYTGHFTTEFLPQSCKLSSVQNFWPKFSKYFWRKLIESRSVKKNICFVFKVICVTFYWFSRDCFFFNIFFFLPEISCTRSACKLYVFKNAFLKTCPYWITFRKTYPPPTVFL